MYLKKGRKAIFIQHQGEDKKGESTQSLIALDKT